jgi:YbbR domain-containing protein
VSRVHGKIGTMKLFKAFVFNNIGLKITAFLIAVLIWAIIAGKERTFSEKTFKSPIEIVNLSSTIDIRSIKPEEIQITIQGPSTQIKDITPEKMKARIDLKDVVETTKLNLLAEDCIRMPDGFHLLNIHPRMIELAVEELLEKDLQVKPRFRGVLKKELQIINTQVFPEKIGAIGFKSQMKDLDTIATDEIDLSHLTQSAILRIPVKHPREILKFPDKKEVDVTLVIVTKNDTAKK